jgi:hypothetical protein
LEPVEIGELSMDFGLLWRVKRRLPIVPQLEMTPERWMLEVRTLHPKTEQPMTRKEAHRLILALQLLGFELHGKGRIGEQTRPNFSGATFGVPVRLPSRGSTKTCSEDTLKAALELSRKIPEEAIIQPKKPQHVALHRFLLGAADESRADAIIDFVIALEGFLLSGIKGEELRLRFSLYGSRFLSFDTAERKTLFLALRDMYDLRSKLVHGNEMPTSVELENGVKTARHLAERILTNGLQNHWPSPNELSELIHA